MIQNKSISLPIVYRSTFYIAMTQENFKHSALSWKLLHNVLTVTSVTSVSKVQNKYTQSRDNMKKKALATQKSYLHGECMNSKDLYTMSKFLWNSYFSLETLPKCSKCKNYEWSQKPYLNNHKHLESYHSCIMREQNVFHRFSWAGGKDIACCNGAT